MRARLPISVKRLSSATAPAPTPITAMRPPTASASRLAARLGAPTSSRTTSKGPCAGEAVGCHDGGAEGGDGVAAVGVAHRRGDLRAGRDRQLDAGGADAPGRAVHERPLAHRQPALGEQRVVRGGEHLGEAARGLPGDAVGHGQGGALVHDGQLGLPAATDHRHHPVADGEALDAAARRRPPRPPARGRARRRARPEARG